MIKLGIGVPTLNRYDLLKESLATLLPQSDDFEHLLIVDNGNQKINVDSKKTSIIINDSNKGVAGSWNQIINELVDKHDVTHVLMLNDDIVLHEVQIKTIKEQIEKYKDKLLLIGDLGWSSWVLDIKCLETMEYEPKKYFDEKFFPAYFEDNDFHYRLKLAGIDHSIALHELGPKVRRASMTIAKNRKITTGSNNGGYYSQKWGGLPGHEKFKTPFNQTTVSAKTLKLKECFVIYGKTLKSLETIESIRNLYSTAKILFVPFAHDSRLLNNIQFDENYNIKVCHLPIHTCMTAAISVALDHMYDSEYFYFFNEYALLRKRIDHVKANDVISVANFGPGFDSAKQSNWLKDQMNAHCPALNLPEVMNGSKWNGVYGSMFGCTKETLVKIKETGFMDILPTSINESQAMERGWGILFKALDLDHITHSLCGDFFKFLPRPVNDYMELRITGNGGE